jgi:hypothetical protein
MNVMIKNTIRDPLEVGMIKLEEFIIRKSCEWESTCKEIIRTGAVDTGVLLNSIYTELTENGFIGISSVNYMKYIEFGTEPHFVPWYDESGKPVLAGWGKRVLKLTPEEMKKMGGIVVSNEELAPMRRALAKL